MAAEHTSKGRDIFLGFGDLIVVLVFLHIVVFLFWIYLLIRGAKDKKTVQQKQD